MRKSNNHVCSSFFKKDASNLFVRLMDSKGQIHLGSQVADTAASTWLRCLFSLNYPKLPTWMNNWNRKHSPHGRYQILAEWLLSGSRKHGVFVEWKPKQNWSGDDWEGRGCGRWRSTLCRIIATHAIREHWQHLQPLIQWVKCGDGSKIKWLRHLLKNVPFIFIRMDSIEKSIYQQLERKEGSANHFD